MGSSSWKYFVPYQKDIEAVLQNLRREVFTRNLKTGAKEEKIARLKEELAASDVPDPYGTLTVYREVMKAKISQFESLHEPTSIDEEIDQLITNGAS